MHFSDPMLKRAKLRRSASVIWVLLVFSIIASFDTSELRTALVSAKNPLFSWYPQHITKYHIEAENGFGIYL